MKHIIFAIYDSKAQAYLPPFIMHRTEMATRVFADCVNDYPNHQFSKNPQDYTLFTIGQFDDNTAKIKTEKMILSLGNGLEFQVPDSEVAYDAQNNQPQFNAFDDQKTNSGDQPNAD